MKKIMMLFMAVFLLLLTACTGLFYRMDPVVKDAKAEFDRLSLKIETNLALYQEGKYHYRQLKSIYIDTEITVYNGSETNKEYVYTDEYLNLSADKQQKLKDANRFALKVRDYYEPLQEEWDKIKAKAAKGIIKYEEARSLSIKIEKGYEKFKEFFSSVKFLRKL